MVREAISSIARGSADRKTLDLARKTRFLEGLAAGLTIAESSALIGMSARRIYQVRNSDEVFDEACVACIEIGCDRVLARAQAIALYGEPDAMPTIKAMELYLKINHRNGRNQAASSLRLERQMPDGSRQIIAATSHGISK